MNNLTIRKSAVNSTGRNPGIRVPMRVLFLVLCAGLVFSNLAANAFAQSSCPGIHVKIPNIKNNVGSVACALYSKPEGFPEKFLKFADKIIMTKIRGREARSVFTDIKPGTYAVAVIHDENLNGELDTNWLGVPTEGYGFSNDATASFSAPSFSDAKFSYDGGVLVLTISLNY